MALSRLQKASKRSIMWFSSVFNISARYLYAHWCGAHPPWRVVLLHLGMVYFAMSVAVAVLSPILSAMASALAICVLLMVLVWQLVGAFRTASRCASHSTEQGLAWLIYFAMLALLLASGARVLDLVLYVDANAGIQTETALPRTLLPVSDDGLTVTIVGEIDYRVYAAFVETIEQHATLKAVSLAGPGGNVFAARALAHKILHHRFDTRSAGNCFSACTLAFLAGTTRTLGANGRLGFHRYAAMTPHAQIMIDVGVQIETDKAYMRERGVSGSFIERAYATPPDRTWIPARTVLLRSGFIHQ